MELVQLDPRNGAVDEFLALEGIRLEGRRGHSPLGPRLACPLLRRSLPRLRAPGEARDDGPALCGSTLAMATLLAARNSRYAFKMAFDEEFRKQAPGAQLIVEFTEHPRDGGAHYMDSCAAPDNEIMNRLWPDRRALVSVALARPGVRAGVFKQALRLAGRAPATEVATR